MEDDELEKIRAKRLADLQQQYGNKGGGGAGGPSDAAEKQAKEAEARNAFLSQVLNQQARARLNTIAIAKPEKAKMVENMLMNMMRVGQVHGKLGEEDLISLLEKVSEHTKKKTTIKFDRKRNVMDDDDDF